jgi:hypothetical protein
MKQYLFNQAEKFNIHLERHKKLSIIPYFKTNLIKKEAHIVLDINLDKIDFSDFFN